MKSKMNIKSVILISIILLLSMLFINISLAANTGTINVETANLRETADAESKILEQLSLNQEVEIVEKSGDWYKVTHNKITGYVRQDLVKVKEEKKSNNVITETNQVAKENTVIANNTQSNVVLTEKNSELGEYVLVADTKLKLVPTINATDVVEIKKDEKVTAIDFINDWACVETKTTKGWIRKEKIQREQKVDQKQEEIKQEQQIQVKTKYINSTSVNVRKEPNTSSEIIANAIQNTAVEVTKEENGWSKITLNGKEGYISSTLLSDNKQEVTKSNATSRGANTSRRTTQKEKNTNLDEKNLENITTTASSSKGEAIIATAKKYLGYKYVYGGTSPSQGFDCSGFTSYVYRQHGISLNRTAGAQYSNGTYVSRANLQPGDLVMFGSPINHVAIYIGGGKIIHASTPSTGVRIDSLSSSYYSKNYTGARRVI